MNDISRAELKGLLDSGAALALLEALPERYYREGHLPSAKLFPHTEVRERAELLLPDMAQPIVVYCANAACRNSHTAAALLRNLGYQNVSVYAGGKADWSDAGLPLEH
jgi:rhodanese-related sulfurtransferase